MAEKNGYGSKKSWPSFEYQLEPILLELERLFRAIAPLELLAL